jgi:hypothetical protein
MEELLVCGVEGLGDRGFPFLHEGGFGGVGRKDDDLSADQAGEGGGGLGDDAGYFDGLGEGGGLEGSFVQALDLLAEDVDLGGEVDMGELFGTILGRFGARGEAVLAGIDVAGLGAAAAFIGFGGGKGRGVGGHGEQLLILSN